jgi:hypothetical protein
MRQQPTFDVVSINHVARSDRKTGAGLRQVPDACAAALKALMERRLFLSAADHHRVRSVDRLDA